MLKKAFLLAMMLGIQPAWADDDVLSYRVSGDPTFQVKGTITYTSGRVTLADGRVCDRCKVGSVGGFVTSITDKAGNNWPLSPGLLQIDTHPLRTAYRKSMQDAKKWDYTYHSHSHSHSSHSDHEDKTED